MRNLRILHDPEDLLRMPDKRLDYLADEYQEQCLAVPFHQFAADRNAAMINTIAALRRNPLCRVPAVDALPI